MFGNGVRLGSTPMAYFAKKLVGVSNLQNTPIEAKKNDCDILILSKCYAPDRDTFKGYFS